MKTYINPIIKVVKISNIDILTMSNENAKNSYDELVGFSSVAGTFNFFG